MAQGAQARWNPRPGRYRLLPHDAASCHPIRQAVARTRAVKAAHSSWLMTRTGPWGFSLSRTATVPGRLQATSTQLPPLSPLREDLRHSARVRSVCPQLLSGKVRPARPGCWLWFVHDRCRVLCTGGLGKNPHTPHQPTPAAGWSSNGPDNCNPAREAHLAPLSPATTATTSKNTPASPPTRKPAHHRRPALPPAPAWHTRPPGHGALRALLPYSHGQSTLTSPDSRALADVYAGR